MSDSSEAGFLFGGIIIGGIIIGGLAVALWMGSAGTPDINWHAEAVKHGAAHWDVKPDGSTEFKWNTEAKP